MSHHTEDSTIRRYWFQLTLSMVRFKHSVCPSIYWWNVSGLDMQVAKRHRSICTSEPIYDLLKWIWYVSVTFVRLIQHVHPFEVHIKGSSKACEGEYGSNPFLRDVTSWCTGIALCAVFIDSKIVSPVAPRLRFKSHLGPKVPTPRCVGYTFRIDFQICGPSGTTT